MIRVYRQDTTDFSGLGLGGLRPIACTVTERALGEYAADVTCAVDALGGWRLLEPERIITAPTPVEHPTLAALRASGESRPTLMATAQFAAMRLDGLTIRRAKRYLALEPSAGSDGWLCVDHAGDVGYVAEADVVADGLATVGAFGVARGSRQPFRVMSVDKSPTEVRAYARHLWYDAIGCIVAEMAAEDRTYAQAVGLLRDNLIGGALPGTHGAPDNAADKHDISYTAKSAVEVLLGGGGLLETWGGRLYRSWYSWWVSGAIPGSLSPVLRDGRQLTGYTGTDDDSDVYTHIVPIGADADGAPLLLPEVAVVSEYAELYPRPMYKAINVSGAKVSNKMTKSQAIKKLRSAAREELGAGCDLPMQSITLDAAAIRDTELDRVRLGDTVYVVSPRLGIRRGLPCTEYGYDALRGMYTSITLGDPPATLATAAMEERRNRLITEGVIAGGGDPVEEVVSTSACTATHNTMDGGGWNTIGASNNAIIGTSDGHTYQARFSFPALSGSPGSLAVRIPRNYATGAGVWHVHLTDSASDHGTGSNALYNMPVTGGTGDVLADLTDRISTITGWSSTWYVIVSCQSGLYWVPGGTNTTLETGVYTG